MKIHLKRTDRDFGLEAQNEDGNTFVMDASSGIGGNGNGMRPMQVVLSALGGCSAIDVILILRKQKQTVTSFEIELEAERKKINDYSLFKEITLHYKIKGEVNFEKAERAIQLSLEKYCSVAKTLEPTASIHYKLTVN